MPTTTAHPSHPRAVAASTTAVAAFGRPISIGVVLLAAAAISAGARTITSVLTNTLGNAWPFSLVHCTTASPGCTLPVTTGRATR